MRFSPEDMIDLHCHILPGLDDGAESLEESVSMARVAVEDGIRAVVATPHLFRGQDDVYEIDVVEAKREELKKALREAHVPLEVLAGVEVRFSHNLIEAVRKDRKHLVINNTSYLFVEFPFDHVYSGIREVFFELMSEGLSPIITHPERNSVFISHPERLADLVSMGAFSQANSGSFSGLYGSSVQEAALRFLQWGLFHVIASDAHNSTSRAPQLTPALEAAQAVIGPENARALVEDNPRAVVEDRALPYQPEPVDLRARGREKGLKIKMPSILKRKTS